MLSFCFLFTERVADDLVRERAKLGVWLLFYGVRVDYGTNGDGYLRGKTAENMLGSLGGHQDDGAFRPFGGDKRAFLEFAHAPILRARAFWENAEA